MTTHSNSSHPPRTILWLLAVLSCGIAGPTRATEIARVIAGMGNLESVAGGNGLGSGNPNEWQTPAENGLGMAAELSEPHMAMNDIWGNIYVADKNAHAIRKIDPTGIISTVAGRHRFLSPNAGGFDGDGFGPDKLLSYPNGLFVFPDGTLYFLETGDASTLGRIRRLSRDGTLTTIHTEPGFVMQRGLWVSPDAQTIYFTTNTQLRRLHINEPLGPTNPQILLNLTSAANLANIDVDRQGNILVADRGQHRVYLVPPTAVGLTSPEVVAGNGMGGTTLGNNSIDSGEVATSIVLNEARGVAYHPEGGFFVACHKGGDIWYVDTQTPPRIHMLIRGNDRDSNSSPLRGGDGQLITTDQNTAKLAEPRSVRYGWNGDLILCCNDSGFVRVVRSVRPPAAPFTATLNSVGSISWLARPDGAYFMETSSSLAAWETHSWRFPVATLPGVQSIPSSGPTASRQFHRVHEFRRWPF